MREEILITVIIPIYNVEEYLSRCLDSVAYQSYTNFEAILVNDGSTDGSRKIAEEYVRKDRRFKLINQENKGLGGARNTGYNYCRGKYMVSIDSDDWLHPDYLRILLETAVQFNTDIVECGRRNVRKEDKLIVALPTHREVKIIDNKEEYLYTVSYVAWNKLYRSELFEGILFPEHMSKQDYACIPRVLARADKIVTISDPLYCYLWRSNSATNAVKINFNLLKAQNILEESEFHTSYPRVLSVYFARNILGTLVWNLLNDGQLDRAKEIVDEGLNKYHDIESVIKSEFIGRGKTIYGKLLIHGCYSACTIYVHVYEMIRACLRKGKYMYIHLMKDLENLKKHLQINNAGGVVPETCFVVIGGY